MTNLTLLPFGLPGQVYRSPMPFANFDHNQTTLKEYQEAGVNAVVMLVSDDEGLARAGRDLRETYVEAGIEVIHLPIVDFAVPTDNGELETALQRALTTVHGGGNLAVHCYAGRGRTGMFIALMARRILKLDGVAAIEWARQYFPAVETEEQAMIVIEDQAVD